ncbi:MAG: hypothetical protein ABIG64_01910 [Candidatus Omnitrophota bacterium]
MKLIPKIKFNKQGFTIMEAIISSSIFAVVIGSLFAMLIIQNNFFQTVNARTDMSQTARKVMNNMVKELRISKIESVDLYARPLHISGTEDTINATSICFQIPVDSNPGDGNYNFFDEFGRVVWGADNVDGYKIEYYWDQENQRILRRVWDASDTAVYENVIAENITGFRMQGFSWNSGAQTYESKSGGPCDVVEITVTAEKTNLGGRTLEMPIVYTLKNQVTWRN